MDERPTPHLPFSRAQRWDLFRMTAAALVSTGLFAAPVVMSTRTRVIAPIAASVPADRVQLVTTDVVAPVTTPELQVLHPRIVRAASVPGARPRAVRAASRPADRTLSRRVALIIAGDGRYAVRPFPTVDTADR